MDNETLTEFKPKYYVKFDVNSGKIMQMSMAPLKEDPMSHIKVTQTENPLVGQVIAGTFSKRAIGPMFDIETNTWEIGKKGTKLHLKELSTRLTQVTQNNNPNAVDISVDIYKADKTMEISANIGIIKKNMNLADVAEISKSKDAGLLNLYFTRKGDPDYLVTSIQVDPTILLRAKKLKYNLPEDVTKYSALEEISIFTRPIFHSYSLQILDKFVESDYYLGKHTVVQVAKEQSPYHATLLRNGSSVKVTSFIGNDAKHLFTSNQIRFVVCDNDIDIPVGTFTVDSADLFNGNSTVDLDFDWPEKPLITYKARGLVISYLGDTYGGTN